MSLLARALARVPRSGLVLLAGPSFASQPELIDHVLNAAPRQSGEVVVRAIIAPDLQRPEQWPAGKARGMAAGDPTARFLLLAMTHPPAAVLAEADVVLTWTGFEQGWRAEPRAA